MNYKQEFSEIKTLDELFGFRERVLQKESIFSSHENKELDIGNIKKCQEANFWLEIVNFRIKSLFKNGHTIDKIDEEQKQ